MVRIHATPIVAPMTYEHPRDDISIVNSIRRAVGSFKIFEMEKTISVMGLTGVPHPAIVWIYSNRNLGLKSPYDMFRDFWSCASGFYCWCFRNGIHGSIVTIARAVSVLNTPLRLAQFDEINYSEKQA